jgi:hypothetical protein
MFFALTLTVLVVSYSGLALEQARRQAESYALRYSLERTANDAADVLVKTAGRPHGWEKDVTILEVPGLAEENDGRPVQNTLDVRKLGWLRELCRSENWDTSKSEIQAIMALFGGSENFEIKIISTEMLAREKLDEDEEFELDTTLFGLDLEVEAENKGTVINVKFEFEDTKKSGQGTDFTLSIQEDNILVEVVVKGGWIEVGYKITLWDIWPGWDAETSSGVENSLEVAVVRRSVAKRRSGSIRSDVRGLQHLIAEPDGKDYTLDFWVYPGELDVFDWYLLLRPSEKTKPTTKVWVNRATGDADYSFPPALDSNIYMLRYHGTDYPETPLTDAENDGQPNNYLRIKVTGSPAQWVDVFIIILPRCSSLEFASDAPDTIPVTLEIKLWR